MAELIKVKGALRTRVPAFSCGRDILGRDAHDERLPMPRKLPRKSSSPGDSVGQRLAQLRKARGLTQAELAARLGISQASISEYERDVFRLNSDLIIDISNILEVSADELLGLQPAPKATAIKDQRLLHRMAQIDQLPKRKKDALLMTIKAFLAEGR